MVGRQERGKPIDGSERGKLKEKQWVVVIG
jgi:hypothetical protein